MLYCISPADRFLCADNFVKAILPSYSYHIL